MAQKLSDEQRAAYLNTLRLSRGINLPKIATEVGLNYARDVAPAIRASEEFRDAISNYLFELRFELLDGILTGARTGKTRIVDVASAKAMLNLIDSGLILGPALEAAEPEATGEVQSLIAGLLGQSDRETPVDEPQDEP